MATNTHPIMRDLMSHVLQVLYMLFLGIVIAALFGLGVDNFYPAPKAPEYPTLLQEQQYKTVPTTTQTDAELAAQKKFDADQKQYTEKLKPYTRNVSIVIMILAVLALVVSLTVLSHWEILANGFLLGGVFSMAYSIIQGMISEDTKFRFLVICVAALVTLVLGYIKFIRPNEKSVKS